MKNIYTLIGLFFAFTVSYSQINTTYLSSCDSIYNYFVFKPNINIKVSDLVINHRDVVRLASNNVLIQEKVEVDKMGMIHHRYKQYYQNVKVEDSQFYIHANANDIPLTANGEKSDDINISVSPSISSAQAISNAISYAKAAKYYWEDAVYEASIKEITRNPDTSYYPGAELVIINLNATHSRTISPVYKLAYKVPIHSLSPFDSYYLFMDANNGKFLLKKQIMKNCFGNNSFNVKPQTGVNLPTAGSNNNFSSNVSESCAADCQSGTAHTLYYQNQSIAAQKYLRNPLDCTHRLDDKCATEIHVVKCNGDDYFDNDNDWNTTNEKPGNTALWCLEKTYDFYKNTYGRISFDNNNSFIKLFAQAKFDGNGNKSCGSGEGQNAYWDGSTLTIGSGTGTGPFNNDLTTLDIIGHELTHGVTQYEAALVYQGESGALNESFSDIFGTMVDFYGKTNFSTGLSPNYLLGEECTSAGQLRNMSNPNASGGGAQPDTYLGTYWANTSSGADAGGVHTNSGVQNFWFYLLSEGGTGTNDNSNQYCVAGIGKDKAAAIAYRALTIYLTANMQFIDSRFWTIQAAKDLYGLNSNEVAQVTSAWYAVGVGGVFSGTIEHNGLHVSTTQTLMQNSEIAFNDFYEYPSGNFTVTSNTRIVMKGTTNPILLSAAKDGSYFHAYIAPGCGGGARIKEGNYNSATNNNTSDVTFDNNHEIIKNTPITIIPNPSDGHFTIQIKNSEFFLQREDKNKTQYCTIAFYSMIGEIILKKSFNEETLSIDISNYPKGIYFLKIQTADSKGEVKTYTEKVVVQ